MNSLAVSPATCLPNPLRHRHARPSSATASLHTAAESGGLISQPRSSCHEIPAPLPRATAGFRRREAVGFGLGVGLFDLVFSRNSEAAEEPACELKVAPLGLAYCDKVVGFGTEAVKGHLIKIIKGWDEGIIGGEGVPPMLAGGKRILRLPPALGYGMRGAGCRGGSCVIPPDSVLLFDVEFIGKA